MLWQCATGLVMAQPAPGRVEGGKVPALRPHFDPEFLDDAPSQPAAWAQHAGLHAAFGSTDRIYLRREVPAIDDGAAPWMASGWRGERLNAVVLVWSANAFEQVHVEATALADERGHVLPPDAVRLRMVRYVLSNHPAGARDTNCDEASGQAAWLMPDRLEPLDRFALPEKSVRPVWVSVDIPASAEIGTYQGTLRVRAGSANLALHVSIRVQAPVLPPPSAWGFRLDLWQNPWVIAWHYGIKPWSDAHRALLKEHLRLYAEAGGKYVTTYAVHSPWQDSSYMIEGGMIDWIKRRDGTWAFDYRVFDEYVSLAADAGVTGAITIYTPLPWANRFRYRDEATDTLVTVTWPPGSDAFREAWRAFLDDLQRHLTSRGWLEKTYLGINENPLDQTLAAIKVLKEHSAHWRITYAGDWHPELTGLVDDYSSVFGKEPADSDVAARSARGSTSTFYVCCTPPTPNTFVFSPPVEGRWLAWYAAARGYDGFLRWAYDAWPADPMRDARHVLWPAGDTFLVYPGASGSVRYEKLREGIADAEKLRIVRRLSAASGDPEVKRLSDALDRDLASIAGERAFDAAALERTLAGARETLTVLADRVAR